jgi:hypothetical protein
MKQSNDDKIHRALKALMDALAWDAQFRKATDWERIIRLRAQVLEMWHEYDRIGPVDLVEYMTGGERRAGA